MVRISSLMRLGTSKCWSPQINECLQGLSESIECPGDTVLVALSRIIQITGGATGVLSSWPRNETINAGHTEINIKTLSAALDRVKSDLNPHVSQNSKSKPPYLAVIDF